MEASLVTVKVWKQQKIHPLGITKEMMVHEDRPGMHGRELCGERDTAANTASQGQCKRNGASFCSEGSEM